MLSQASMLVTSPFYVQIFHKEEIKDVFAIDFKVENCRDQVDFRVLHHMIFDLFNRP